MDLAKTIRDVPDFPKEGILFKDITTLLKDPAALKETIKRMLAYCQGKDIDLVAGIESRGFIFGVTLAYELGVGFVPIRKSGKLPADTISESYSLEYGSNTLEMHLDAVQPGQKVLVVDDLLATGGTAQASCKLIERLGGEVTGLLFVVELNFLNGRDHLAGQEVISIVAFD
jgi:adenine phosphoribosyltransferase